MHKGHEIARFTMSESPATYLCLRRRGHRPHREFGNSVQSKSSPESHLIYYLVTPAFPRITLLCLRVVGLLLAFWKSFGRIPRHPPDPTDRHSPTLPHPPKPTIHLPVTAASAEAHRDWAYTGQDCCQVDPLVGRGPGPRCTFWVAHSRVRQSFLLSLISNLTTRSIEKARDFRRIQNHRDKALASTRAAQTFGRFVRGAMVDTVTACYVELDIIPRAVVGGQRETPERELTG